MKINDYEFPDDLFYVLGEPGHMWIRKMNETSIKIGIDSYASSRAGTIEFVRTMKVDKRVKKNQVVGTYESGKWVGQIKSPIDGTILEKNAALKDQPELINSDPYGDGWLLIIEGKTIDSQLDEDEKIVSSGEQLEEYIQWRISQE
ncbi:MAG: glycine cleavage system protein H [Candidatus Heimdallarchaeota archaeon]|nr:glycine cleavage system protein H [Candidatus Heimdallarchaeota archaeon]